MASHVNVTMLRWVRRGVVVIGTCGALGCHSTTPWVTDTADQDAVADVSADSTTVVDASPDTATHPDVVGDTGTPVDARADVVTTVDAADVVADTHVDTGPDIYDAGVADTGVDVAVPIDAGSPDTGSGDGGSSTSGGGQVVIAYGAPTTATSATTLQLQEPNDLVANPGFETGDFTAWTMVTAGDGWNTVMGLFGTYGAISSYQPETASQTIDLVAAGYTAAQLDAIPTLTVRQWYVGGGINRADHYQFHVDLRDGTGAVLTSYDTGAIITSATWQAASNTFTGYPTGVRSVAITATASDVEFWAGNYGSIIDQASVVIGSVEMQFSNDGTTWSGWMPFTPTATWTLGSTAGVQTVYVQYRDAVTMTALGSATDTITLAP